MRWRGGVSAWLLIAACVGLSGCAIVDQYSGRAIVYNLEAEQAQDQALLLNIVRAYLRRPMQFTTVSSITGVASVSGGTQYTLPTNVPFRPTVQGATGIAQFPPLPTFLFSGSMSGGPAFTVPVLDTQEFYDGILKAIPAQLWDLYIQANYPPDLLFNLFVQKVVMQREDPKGQPDRCEKTDHTQNCEFIFENYPGSDIQINLFQALGDYLLWLGMTTELQKPRTVPFERGQSINVRFVGAPGPDKKGKPPTAEVVGPPGGSSASDGGAAPKTYKLCFTPRVHAELVSGSLCGSKSPDSGAAISTTGSATVSMSLDPEFVCRLIRIAHALEDKDSDARAAENNVKLFEGSKNAICGAERDIGGNRPVSLTIYMRNTEGMIYYLGELARRSLSTSYGLPTRDFFTRLLGTYTIYPHFREVYGCEGPSADCAYIFHLYEGVAPPLGESITVFYGGRSYWVSNNYNAEQPDRSTMTLEFLKQLIAINSSAKSLPQSSVITTVGGQ